MAFLVLIRFRLVVGDGDADGMQFEHGLRRLWNAVGPLGGRLG